MARGSTFGANREEELKESIKSLVDLIEISDQDRLLLTNAAHQTQQWVDEFVKMFYDTLFGYPSTQVLFREGERPHRETTIRNWYLQVVNGKFDEQFWLAQCQIGQRHVDREILNSYMLAMMHKAQQFFLQKCMTTFGQEEGLKVFTAFKRVTDIAAGIIAEGYHTPYAVMKVGR